MVGNRYKIILSISMNLQTNVRHNKSDSTTANKLTTILFIMYLIALCWILLFKLGVQFSYMENRSVNLVPFRELLLSNGKTDTSEIILNVVIFVPLGIYAGILFKRWIFGKQLLFFFLTSLAVEGLQFVLRIGAFDITDIITNKVGGMIGWMLFIIIKKLFSNDTKAQQFINTLAAIGTAVMVILLALLKMNMLSVRYQ